MRFAFTLRLIKSDETDIQTIKRKHLYELIHRNVFAAEEASLELAESVSEKYYHAWGISRSTRVGQRMINDEILFDVTDEVARAVEVNYTIEQLKDIDLVLNEANMEHRLYTEMFGSRHQDKESTSEARELRLLNALQLEKKWLLVTQIQAHAQKSAFLSRAGVSTVEPPSAEPIAAWQYDLELLQGYDPQLLMEFFGNV